MKPILTTTKTLAATVVLVTLGACAKTPDRISAVPMSSAPYTNMACSKLNIEKTRLDLELRNLSADQSRIASADAWGVFLIGIPTSAITGEDKETLISVTKGRIDAIETLQSQKCL